MPAMARLSGFRLAAATELQAGLRVLPNNKALRMKLVGLLTNGPHPRLPEALKLLQDVAPAATTTNGRNKNARNAIRYATVALRSQIGRGSEGIKFASSRRQSAVR